MARVEVCLFLAKGRVRNIRFISGQNTAERGGSVIQLLTVYWSWRQPQLAEMVVVSSKYLPRFIRYCWYGRFRKQLCHDLLDARSPMERTCNAPISFSHMQSFNLLCDFSFCICTMVWRAWSQMRRIVIVYFTDARFALTRTDAANVAEGSTIIPRKHVAWSHVQAWSSLSRSDLSSGVEDWTHHWITLRTDHAVGCCGSCVTASRERSEMRSSFTHLKHSLTVGDGLVARLAFTDVQDFGFDERSSRATTSAGAAGLEHGSPVANWLSGYYRVKTAWKKLSILGTPLLIEHNE